VRKFSLRKPGGVVPSPAPRLLQSRDDHDACSWVCFIHHTTWCRSVFDISTEEDHQTYIRLLRDHLSESEV
jgi:hypothetical protein